MGYLNPAVDIIDQKVKIEKAKLCEPVKKMCASHNIEETIKLNPELPISIGQPQCSTIDQPVIQNED